MDYVQFKPGEVCRKRYSKNTCSKYCQRSVFSCEFEAVFQQQDAGNEKKSDNSEYRNRDPANFRIGAEIDIMATP